MNINKKKIQLVSFSFLIIVLIFNPSRALNAALDGIDLCLKSVVPGIFPFLFLSSALATVLNGYSLPIIESLLHIPCGTAGFFLIGLLCGYPVGAKLLQNEIEKGNISRTNAVRMITFCNNASPAFIIGILASLFSSIWLAIIIWLIQICASIIIGVLLPGYEEEKVNRNTTQSTNLGSIMTESIKAASAICGWIILFAILLAYIQIPLLGTLSSVSRTLLNGLLELTNGIYSLQHIHSPSIRFTVCTIMLSFGGLCILLQTRSVAPSLRIKPYILGRLLHACISGLLASIISSAIYPYDQACRTCIPLFIAAGIMAMLILYFNKKMVAFNQKI